MVSFKKLLQERVLAAEKQEAQYAARYVKKNMQRWLKQMQAAADCQRTNIVLRIELGFWDRLRITDATAFEEKAKVVLASAIANLGFMTTIGLSGVHVEWSDFQ